MRFVHSHGFIHQDLEDAARYYEMAANTSGSMFEEPRFRCLRGLHRASLSYIQMFSGFSIPDLRVFLECQSARPRRSARLSDFAIDESSHLPTEEIGHGSSSTVLLVKDRNGTFAIKEFHHAVFQSTIINEVLVLAKLNHPCVLRLLGYVLPGKSSPAEIHMEWAQNGSLARVLGLVRTGRCPSFWNPTGIAIIISGIVLGMRFVHSHGFIHQDLNPSNILLNDRGRALIADFGSSRWESPDITPHASGSDQYTAPELYIEDDWGQKIDVYSFGLILYELLVGSPVFREDELRDDILEKKLTGFMPAMGYRISPSMSNLIQACLQLDPILRPSFDDILIFCQRINFGIVPGADSRTVFEYVSGVTDWESCHSGYAELGQYV
jgi:serine/threonine protein kinase